MPLLGAQLDQKPRNNQFGEPDFERPGPGLMRRPGQAGGPKPQENNIPLGQRGHQVGETGPRFKKWGENEENYLYEERGKSEFNLAEDDQKQLQYFEEQQCMIAGNQQPNVRPPQQRRNDPIDQRRDNDQHGRRDRDRSPRSRRHDRDGDRSERDDRRGRDERRMRNDRENRTRFDDDRDRSERRREREDSRSRRGDPSRDEDRSETSRSTSRGDGSPKRPKRGPSRWSKVEEPKHPLPLPGGPVPGSKAPSLAIPRSGLLPKPQAIGQPPRPVKPSLPSTLFVAVY